MSPQGPHFIKHSTAKSKDKSTTGRMVSGISGVLYRKFNRKFVLVSETVRANPTY